MTLTSIMARDPDRRELIRRRAVEGIENVFPLKVRDHHVEVRNVKVAPKQFSSREQKDAILHGRTLQEPLKGDLVLRDSKGKAVDTKKNVTLAQVPYFTPRHTFIVDGNEYTVANQRRVRPGVYTRVRGNEELEATFNLAKGENFRLNMSPEKGHLYMEYGSSRIPLYPVLRGLGISDKQIRQQWGEGVVDANKSAFDKKREQVVKKLYERLVPTYHRTATTSESQVRDIEAAYRETVLDPEVTKKTLGQSFKRVTPTALLRASKKLLDVHRAGEETDDRDSLAFQTLHGVEDFFKERIQLEGRNLARKVAVKASGQATPTLDRVIPASPFTRSLRSFVTNANLSAIPSQINPVEILDSAVRITSLGEGGISSERAVPPEARNLHSTHLGIIDPVRTPESFKAGVDLRGTIWTNRDENGQMYTKLRNARTGRIEYVPIGKLEESTIAFPGEMRRRTGIGALQHGFVRSVPKGAVDYEVIHPAGMYSPTTNLVPMPESLQGNRTVMGSKMSTQALPLVGREAPWIQVASSRPGRSFEEEVADLVLPTAPVSGVVKKIDGDYVYIQPERTKKSEALLIEQEHVEIEKTSASPLVKVHYDNNFPLASKTYLHDDLKVKVGDRVTKGQQLADSNFTRDGSLALGRNMRVGYMAYYGANSNDAVVISQAASEKLTSEHMYKEMLSLDSDVVLDKKKHRAQFPNKWTAAQYANLDDRGVAKAGATIHPGDPVIVALRKISPTAEMAMLGKLHRTLARPFREEVLTWNHKAPGKVIDVVVTPSRAVVTVKTRESAGIGDKIAGRYGNKGVISKIVPDDQMIHTKDGRPVDILMTSAGVISRVNPAQIIETAVAKVAEKTGERIIVPSLSGRNNAAWAKKLLKKHDLTDKEVVHNPITGKDIVGPDGKGVMVGPQYIYKLFKSTDTNYSARGVEDYDVNLQPAKGGEDGAKGLGRMEINAVIAHNARNVLQEASTLKSSRNDEFWRAYQLGQPLPKPKPSFAYDKLGMMLHGAGIKFDKSDEQLMLGPLTDNDVKRMSSGAISKATMIRERDLNPEKGGLFDPVVTGGTQGKRWSHVDLREPIVNPTFEEPVRRLLGYTQNDFRKAVASEGGRGIQKRLRDLDVAARERELRERVRTAKGAQLDNAIKQLKYLKALKAEKLRPDEAYVLSKLPVVPPVARPIMPSRGKRDLLVSDANYLYRDTMLANDALGEMKQTKLPEEVGRARLQLYDTTRAVFGLADPVSPQLRGRKARGFISTIAGQGSPKGGFFHGKLLRLPQDLSGRGTAVPDLALNMDQIGLPEEMMWKTFQPHIIRSMVQKGYKAVDAQRMVEDRHPVARDALVSESKRRPVLVNRAPTLHRYGIIGAYATPVPGKTIRVNPFIENGMNLDYDGDTLQIHVPVSDKAVNEVKSTTMSNMLFGDRTKSELMVMPQHEAVLGVYAASAAKGGKTHTFKSQRAALEAYRRGEIQLHDSVRIG
jgi:DNA-directed RNA polymerase beta subunit